MGPSKKTPPPVNDMTDLIMPVAIRSWLIFLLVFKLMGYSNSFCILFGAIGGFAAGMVSAWWKVKGGAPLPPELSENSEQSTGNRFARIPRIRLRRERRDLLRRRRQRR
ncbi:MAG: hypothetical protein AAGF01_22105 [Cyanobacteria bacterium P01_G01_bin.38]